MRNVGILRDSVLCNFAPAWPVGLGLVLQLLKSLAEILLVPVVSRQNWGQVFTMRLHVSLPASLRMFSIVISIYLNIINYNFEVRHPRCVGSITKNFSCITHTVEHNYISSNSTLGLQLHVSALYVGHLQVVT